ncbi:DUF2252 domain-containing protein [Pseudonocardia alaniniphila]|uniref:DUF2252 domain-containing protein n=1 Tax=Pseudonocardia alaniniphila TaxID=75291 RepID=A0ABS9THM5_9PSEU|nr:DUF2252 domain-containing protein [Pseudonocardia alaniniphila]MCH6168050.1 DUF2252 domain-containing protein [Pseudonocardia alaniniphila]
MVVTSAGDVRAPGKGNAQTQSARQLTRADRAARGKDARASAPLEAHAEFTPDGSRDPIGLLLEQAKSRIPELVPVRHGRMLVSPFAYFRGAALPMAVDLAGTPTSGLRVQLCGDAHLSNFGAFASPERRLVFDVNDFDETLPGPFEWDVKRLGASLAVAGRDNEFSRKARRTVVLSAVEAYRTAMRAFAEQHFLDVWYAHLDVAATLGEVRSQMKRKRVKLTEKTLAKAHTRDSMQALNKLTTVVDGRRQIISMPPLIEPIEEIFADVQVAKIYEVVRAVLGKYRRTLESDRKHLLEYFTLMQVARKVVGVGSVGTRAWVLLMDAEDGTEPLFLQSKEAQPSVLAAFCGRSQYSNEGERVVVGQRLMQAESDILLGWTHVVDPDGTDRDYYVRQLKDWKVSVPIESMIPSGMKVYAHMCGWTLARAHARSGDRFALAAYLGRSAKFDNAIADFAETYADQNERDYAALQAAVKDGRAEATTTI